MSQRVYQKGAQIKPKATKREPTGAQREPKGAAREQKVSQRATKMYEKVDLWKRSRIGRRNGRHVLCFSGRFGSHFPLKADENINAEIDAEEVMKIDEKSMWK